jgi:hypothetical protein
VCCHREYSPLHPPSRRVADHPGSVPSQLVGGLLGMSLLASDTSVEALLQPAKLYQGIRRRGCDVGSRFAVQPLGLD